MDYSTVFEYLQRNGANSPDSPAVLTPGKQASTYAQLLSNAQTVKSALASLGIGRGSNVGLVIESRDVMTGALLTVGSCATAVPISVTELETMSAERLSRLQLDAALIEIHGSTQINVLTELAIPIINVIPDKDHAGLFRLDLEFEARDDSGDYCQFDDPFVLLETSGTTGDPKVAPVTHLSVLTTGLRLLESVDLSEQDRIFIVRPLHHAGGIHEIMRALVSGASLLIDEFEPARFVDDVIDYDVTWFNLVPSMHRAVLPYAQTRTNDLKKSNLRYVRSGSAVLSDDLKQEMEDAWGFPVVEGYGSTETGSLTFNSEDGKSGSLGLVAPGIVSIRDPGGAELLIGSVGEIWVTGPSVFTGYLNDPEANAEAFRGEWFRMGDLGYLDDDGYLFLTGRIKESINRGGETIAPGEIDRVISGLAIVDDCATFGVPHDSLGEDIWAAVKLKHGAKADAAAVRAELSQLLPFAKVPKRIVLVDRIPYNRIGKVDRVELKELYGQTTGQDGTPYTSIST